MDDPKTRQQKYKRREKFTSLGSHKHIRAREALMAKTSNSTSNTTCEKVKKKK